ncbi:hypothetical protein [Maledivibacter halophilus]|uniref:Uncharacterized protein n=1 Tax=Maledivibacter halophilus TaxID=36842 RepID=A0A1T5KEY5_9FIRM|nr:hypothetical protein [Maledivibacter halophilus]SKC61975.1 hypothetical protein SAMN02194393_01727 [Maledivibacter halophilus]
MQKINTAVIEVKDLALDGNIIDNGWIENLRYDNGKPNMNAILILSEIYYWYKPTLIRDEATGKAIGYKQKFKADKLQKSYQALGDRFGISKRQAKLACDFLKEKGLIEIEFRTIVVNGKKLNNVMFIQLIPGELKKITGIDRVLVKDDPPVTTECKRVLQQDVGGSYNEMYHPPTTECKTNTKTTHTETTTKTTNKNNIRQIQNLRLRYSENQLKIIDEYFDILRWTRKHGKIADSVILKIYKKWQEYKVSAVMYALSIYINNPKHHDKKENYCYGIMRNAAAEQIANYQYGGGNSNGKHSQDTEKTGPSEESLRLERIAKEKGLVGADGTIKDTECSF